MDGSGGSLTVTGLANVTIDGNTAGDGIRIVNATFDAVGGGSFNTVNTGSVTIGSSANPVGGTGLALNNVSGDLHLGALNVHGTSGVAVSGSGLYTGAAGMRVASTSGAVSGAAGTGLAVSNATIAASNLNLTRVDSTGGANGIVLNNTDTVGGLRVVGDNASTAVGGNGSGGTIQNTSGGDGSTSGIGVYLVDTSNVVLRRMNITGTHQNFGIRGFRVNGFTLEYSTVTGTHGTNATIDNYGEGAVYFGDDASVATNGLTGSGTITSSIISGGRARNFSVVNTAGTLNRLIVTGSTFGLNQNFATASDSFSIEARNAGTVVNVTVSSSTFTGAPGDVTEFVGQAGTTMDVVFGNNTLTNSHASNVIGGGGMTVATNGVMTFSITGNAMSGADGNALTLQKATLATSLTGTFNGNDIGISGVPSSGSKSGSGIFLGAAGSGVVTLAITNNRILQYAGNAGIYADNTGGDYDVNLTVTGNTLAQPGPFAFAGIALAAGAPSSTDDIDICANIAGNDVSAGDPNGFADIYMGVSTGASSIRLPGYAGSSTTDVENYLKANNLNSGATEVFVYVDAPATAGNFVGGAACPAP